MKNVVAVIIIIAMMLSCLAGCGSSSDNIMTIISEAEYRPEYPEERQHLRVGVLVGPYADMFAAAIKPALISMGYTVDVVIFTEWDATNLALANGEIDLNLFQHSQFLNNFKYEHNLELSAIAEVPTASMVLFSERYDSLNEIGVGAAIALPADATNLARALRILQEAGMITLNPRIDLARVTLDDIVGNSRRLTFNLVDGFGFFEEQIRGSDVVVMSGGRAYASGLNLSDALYNEILRDGFLMVAAARTEDLARHFVKDLLTILHSDEYKEAIIDEESPFSGFQRPRYFF